MRFHLIDRVDEWEPAKSIRARKVTSYSEDYWEGEGDDMTMPPPFVLEAFCQAGTWLIMLTTERRKRAALLQVGSVTWHKEIRPGDVLVMEGQISSFGEESAVLGGTVKVDGETVLECEDVMCALIDGTDLADLDDTERLQKTLTGEAS